MKKPKVLQIEESSDKVQCDPISHHKITVKNLAQPPTWRSL